jgi:hypothetical protein
MASADVQMDDECVEVCKEEAMEEEADEGACESFAAPEADMECAAPAAMPASSAKTMSPNEVLALLNLRRGVEGFWADAGGAEGEELVRALMSQQAGDKAAVAAAAAAAKPAALSGDQWLTVLALAFLRKHCGSEKGTWEGMDSKAQAWLAAGWPQGERSLGFTLLAAQKLV